MPEAHDPYAALRYPDYCCLLAGSVLTSVGSTMLIAAVEYELYQRTKSPVALAAVGLVLFLPLLLLSLPAGHAADRYSRKGLLMAAQTISALATLGLAALSWFEGPLPLIYVCLLVIGSARAFYMPARSSLIPQVVPLEILGNAVTWNSSGWQVASMVGPGLMGVILAVTGLAVGAYLLAVLCALACVVLVAPIRPHIGVRQRQPVTLASLLAGVRFVWKNELILATITLDLFAVLLGGAMVLLSMFAQDILETGPIGYGCLRGAPAVGALLMAVYLAHRPPLRRAGRALLWSVAGFGGAWIVFGLSRNLYLSLGALALTGAFDNVSMVVRGTLIQLLTPDVMRGRVSAVNAIFIGSSNQLGDAESGLMAYLFGPVISVVSGGIGTLLVVLTVMLKWPAVLRLGSLHHAGREVTAEEVPAVIAETEQVPFSP